MSLLVYAVMDLGCANRVNVRKSRTQKILRTRFSVVDFGGLKSRRVRRIAYAKSRRVRKIESSWARFTYATRFCVRDFCWDFTECDLRTLGAICVRDLRTRFAYATRFCVRDAILCTRLEFSSTAIFRTKLGAIYVPDLRTRFAYATRFCVRDAIFRACANRVLKRSLKNIYIQ